MTVLYQWVVGAEIHHPDPAPSWADMVRDPRVALRDPEEAPWCSHSEAFGSEEEAGLFVQAMREAYPTVRWTVEKEPRS